MAEAVQPDELPIDQSLDQTLRTLLEAEYERYIRLAEGPELLFYSRLSPIIEQNHGKFLETKKVLDSFNSLVNESPTEAANLLAQLAFHFEHSQSQSRKTRAGSSLELQIEYLLRESGITKWERQKKLAMPGGKKTKVDFIFPSVAHFTRDPQDCIAFCCQTTSNDRFRSALAQVLGGMKFIPTGIGCDNFGSNLQKLSLEKLDEVQQSGAKYVMFPEGKGKFEHMTDHPAIVTYGEVISRIKERHDAWPNF